MRNSIRYRRFFWFLVILAVMGNVVIDVFLSKESSDAAAAGAWVQRSYQIIQELDRTSSDIAQLRAFASHESKEFKTQLDDLLIHLKNLGALTVDSSNESHYVRRLEEVMAQPYGPKIADQTRAILRGMRSEEDKILLGRLRSDEIQTQLAHREMRWGSFIDTSLMVLLILMYWFDIKAKQKTETLLKDTVRTTEAANQKLEALSQSRFNLLRTTAHDLKNPLGSIAGFADLIKTDQPDQDTVRTLIERIQRISNETLELVGGLIEPEGVKGPVDLRELLEHVHAQNESLAWRKRQTLNLAISGSGPMIVEGEKIKVREIFQNIISNAIKFSPLATEISVRASTRGRFVHIEIQDQGPGFSAQDKRRAFTRNERLSAKPTGGESSTGLGLPIVKELIDHHHAAIRIDDAPGGGTVFHIEWPLS